MAGRLGAAVVADAVAVAADVAPADCVMCAEAAPIAAARAASSPAGTVAVAVG